MRIEIVNSTGGRPERLAAEVEIVFEEGALAGMRLVGFSIWKGTDGEHYVTVPSRAFGAGSERRYFDFLRPTDPASAKAPRRLNTAILEAFNAATDQPVQHANVGAHSVGCVCEACSVVRARDERGY